jgi:hypothetical protein
MSKQTENRDTPQLDVKKNSQIAEEKGLDRAAEESAEKAEKTEQRYDSEHDIFTR